MVYAVFTVNGFNHIFLHIGFLGGIFEFGWRRKVTIQNENLEVDHMPRVFLMASVKATWQGERVDVTPTTAEEMAALSVRLLIEELGSERARKVLRRELARYRRDYKGSGRDDRGAISS